MNRKDIIQLAGKVWLTEYGVKELSLGNEVEIEIGDLEQFAALVAAAEREAISDEWWMCVQSDLENGVKSLNEAATTKWQKEYPEISKFAAWLEARGNND
jgi:hypothetical protein